MEPMSSAIPMSLSHGRDRRRVCVWAGLWIVLYLADIVLFDFGLVPSPTARGVLVGVAAISCCGFVIASVRFLRRADERTYRIAVDAAAIGFCCSLVLVSSFWLSILAGGPSRRVGDILVAMTLTWLIAQVVLDRRHPGGTGGVANEGRQVPNREA